MRYCNALVVVLSVLLAPAKAMAATLSSAEGLVDVSALDLNQTRELDVPWDFFWQTRLDPFTAGEQRAEQRVAVDRPWNFFVDPDTGKQLGAVGFATYRLRLTGLRPRPEGYKIELPAMAGDLKIFVYRDGDESRFVMQEMRNTNPSYRVARAISARFWPVSSHDLWICLIQINNNYAAERRPRSLPILGPGDQPPNLSIAAEADTQLSEFARADNAVPFIQYLGKPRKIPTH